ncbi:hypothetical protein [Lentzea sp. NPDC060358]|uniref:hypothetical protein n=1 Tax=Lentzea sp. NPDC060358 TaxID=3347103 RepID=UPI00365CC0B7
MASGGAVALLLRTAALGGLTAAAWLLGGTTASASPDQAPPAVEITAGAPAAAGATAEAPAPGENTAVETTAGITDVAPPPVETAAAGSAAAPSLMDDPAGWAQAFVANVMDRHEPAKLALAPFVVPPQSQSGDEAAEEPEQDEGPVLDFTGGTKGTVRSGSVSNQAPPEVIQAKAQVRAARKAAKLAAELPPPPPPPAPPVVAVKQVVPLLPDLLSPPAPAKAEQAPVSDLTWTTPGPGAPLPAPQQAPVVATASAASGHTDNSGGTRGVLAVLTSQNSLFPTTTWSVEERRDGTAPGSIPGLPATSPD